MSSIKVNYLPTMFCYDSTSQGLCIFLSYDIDELESDDNYKELKNLAIIVPANRTSNVKKYINLGQVLSTEDEEVKVSNIVIKKCGLNNNYYISGIYTSNNNKGKNTMSESYLATENGVEPEGIYDSLNCSSDLDKASFELLGLLDTESDNIETIKTMAEDYANCSTNTEWCEKYKDVLTNKINVNYALLVKRMIQSSKDMFGSASKFYKSGIEYGLPLEISDTKTSEDTFAWARIVTSDFNKVTDKTSYEGYTSLTITSTYTSELNKQYKNIDNSSGGYLYYDKEDGREYKKIDSGQQLFKLMFSKKEDEKTVCLNFYIIAAESIKLYLLTNEKRVFEKIPGISTSVDRTTKVVNFNEAVNAGSVLKSLANSKLIIGNAEIRDYSDVANDLIAKVNDTIKKYTVFRNTSSNSKNYEKLIDEEDSEKPSLLNIQNYYDTLSGMTPWVEVQLLNSINNDGSRNFTKYDSNTCPFIRSVSINDTGVKKITLEMWDKDFGSYYYAYGKNGNTSLTSSLERNIQNAISKGNISASSNLNNKYYSSEASETELANSGTLLDIVTGTKSSVTNLKVRIGYNDYNQYWSDVSEDYKEYIYGEEGGSKRSNRYWDMTQINTPTVTGKVYYPGSSGTAAKKVDNVSTNFPKCFEAEDCKDNVVNANIGWLEGVGLSSSNSKIDRKTQVLTSPNQNSIKTQELEFMITGYNSKLTQDGIIYTIEGVEVKHMDVLNYSIIQRYEQINNTPKMVLYTLMRLFNETVNGMVIKAPKIYWADPNEIYEEQETVETEETENMSAEAINETRVKKITISLGGQNAYYNYHQNDTATPHFISYKSIASLLDEFCAACPPIKDGAEPTSVIINGETVELENENETYSRPLTWTTGTIKIGDKEETGIFLHYKKPMKVKKIRNYCWGPGNTTPTCIKDLSIENKNEFAVIAGVNSLSLDNKKSNYENTFINYYENSSDKNAAKILIKRKMKSLYNVSNRITDSHGDRNMLTAYSNAMYEGKITVLGDPFYSFDEVMVPFNYPIYLNIEVPASEADMLVENNNSEKINGSESMDAIEGIKVTTHKRKHILSGYYVVKSIEHSISASGFETTLGVISYPGLESQLGVTTDNEKEINKFINSLGASTSSS